MITVRIAMDSVRIDKWLWAVRVFKTRTAAVEACKAGHVKIQGKSVKPAREIKVGETVEAYNGAVNRIVRARSLADKRVGAALVSELIDDLTPPEQLKPKSEPNFVPIRLRRGKPDKKQRRDLRRFKENQ